MLKLLYNNLKQTEMCVNFGPQLTQPILGPKPALPKD